MDKLSLGSYTEILFRVPLASYDIHVNSLSIFIDTFVLHKDVWGKVKEVITPPPPLLLKDFLV